MAASAALLEVEVALQPDPVLCMVCEDAPVRDRKSLLCLSCFADPAPHDDEY